MTASEIWNLEWLILVSNHSCVSTGQFWHRLLQVESRLNWFWTRPPFTALPTSLLSPDRCYQTLAFGQCPRLYQSFPCQHWPLNSYDKLISGCDFVGACFTTNFYQPPNATSTCSTKSRTGDTFTRVEASLGASLSIYLHVCANGILSLIAWLCEGNCFCEHLDHFTL